MNKQTSIYLDCARFLAAFAVMLCHIDEYIVPGNIPFIDHIGVESVGVFFVLSGFVIGYATEFREHDLRTYVINRAARLYSVVIPCLTLTLFLDTAGKHFLHGLYYGRETFLRETLHVLFSFSFLNYIWLLPHPVAPGNDGPFWSLCFEVPYYVVFGAAWFFRGFWRWLVPALVLLIAGPGIIAFFPVWLLGLGIYHLCRRIDLPAIAGRTILALSVLMWLAYEWLLWHFNICPDVPAIIKSGPILLYGSGLCFAVSIIGFRYSAISLAWIAAPARWLAGATFTLYLLHFPLAWLLSGVLAVSPAATAPAALRWLLVAGPTFLLVLITAQFTERRKHVWRRGIEYIIGVAERVFRIRPRRLKPG